MESHEYTINQNSSSIIANKVASEKDLWVNIDEQLKFTIHTNMAATKSNGMLGN